MLGAWFDSFVCPERDPSMFDCSATEYPKLSSSPELSGRLRRSRDIAPEVSHRLGMNCLPAQVRAVGVSPWRARAMLASKLLTPAAAPDLSEGRFWNRNSERGESISGGAMVALRMRAIAIRHALVPDDAVLR